MTSACPRIFIAWLKSCIIRFIFHIGGDILQSLTLKQKDKEIFKEKVLDKYNGLSTIDAEAILRRDGLNCIDTGKKKSWLMVFLQQFCDFMVIVLLACTAVSIFMGEISEAITIMIIVLINSIFGFVQEFKTEKTMQALEGLSAPTARVVRDGELLEIKACGVVRGDLVVLETGDKIPADGIVLEGTCLMVDESILTGESVPVEKIPDKRYTGGKSSSIEHQVYMGTVVTTGRAKFIVKETGMYTQMGKIAGMIKDGEQQETPLQRKLDRLGKYIVYGCLIICAIVSLVGILQGNPVFDMLLAGISLAVAAVPEGLPAVVTVSLAIGVRRMVSKNALVRKLPAVETLGCTDIICSDKTGTLTQNKMAVVEIYSGRSLYKIDEHGFSINSGFGVEVKRIKAALSKSIQLLMKTVILCSNVVISVDVDKDEYGQERTDLDSYKLIGDPTECALINSAIVAGVNIEEILESNERLNEKAFSSETKYMSVICEDENGEKYMYVKGAPDIVLEMCSEIYTAEIIRKVGDKDKERIRKQNEVMASSALRVIAAAYKKISFQSKDRLDKKHMVTNSSSIEDSNEFIFLGLFGMIDPPRAEAYKAVEKCELAGIKPIMITGDHMLTAKAIAKKLKIYREGEEVLTGGKLDELNDEELRRALKKTSVFARVMPKHKLRIVKLLKEQGHVVAMTGDGVNDAPAIKEADIGVAMGKTGTDVTREAASMILTDDNFATIVSAVEEGRVIYSNIRKFIRYLLSCNIGEVVTMFIGMLAGLPLPLLPVQILLVNLATDGLPAIALGLEPPEKGIMNKKPRSSSDNIFSDGLGKLIGFRGVLIGLSTLAVFYSILLLSGRVEIARTAALVTLVLTQLIHVFECKSEDKSIFEVELLNNYWLIGAVACSLIIILSVVYLPVLQFIFKTVALEYTHWMIIIGVSMLVPVLSSLFKKTQAKTKKSA